ncbi:MAG TPA: LysM peptidoglycan-binding domain-containing M23 family metallopeptidase [Candidatus Eisenbacteria bacterium]|nr:LysM peptidoglycan-binding domain-containing M23 family metallopeptidase [Candidatus Eisenbacteria bacterium]
MPRKIQFGIFVGVALLLSFLPGCAQKTASVPAASFGRAHGVYHVVRPGENLYRIGKAYGVAIEELARINGIKDPKLIFSGQRLLIPGANRALPVETIAPAESAERDHGTHSLEPPDETLIWPIAGTVNSGFGPRGSGFHDGIDIAALEGTPVRAVDKGEVIYSDQIRGYGNIVIIRHEGGIVSVYAHNQINLVGAGQAVEQGDIIAKVGSTGRVTGPHLHFEIRKRNVAQDPVRYLPQLCCHRASDTVEPNG